MSRTFSQPSTESYPPTEHATLRKLRHWRLLIVLAVAVLTLVAASVAIGQVSLNYDLACRGMLTAGGGVNTTNDFAVVGSLGVPIIPPKDSDTTPTYAVRSADFAVRGGFLPAYPNGQRATLVTNAGESEPATGEQALVQHLPIVRKAMRIIRGGC